MSSLSNYLVESLLNEIQEGTIVLFPGGFKPPHGGHFELAKRYAAEPTVSQVIILIGPGEREGITREQSIAVWRELIKNEPKILVQQTEVNSPLAAAYKFIETAKPGTYALAASSKGEDYARVKDFVKGHSEGGKYARKGVFVRELPLNTSPIIYKNRSEKAAKYAPGKSENGKGISASVLRADLKNNDKEAFATSYPNVADKAITDKIFDILKKSSINEGKLRVFDFDDTLVQTSSKIHVIKRITGKKITMSPAEYAVYTPDEGDVFDFSEFEGPIKSGTELKKYTNIMRRMLGTSPDDRKVVVLTARGNGSDVEKYLNAIGISVPVIAVNSSDPYKKSEWIEQQIQQGYDDVYFLDDSPKNIAAVDQLKVKYPNAKIRTQNVLKDEPAVPLMEGGAAGHLAHPYEDIDLTFGEIKTMIELALGGKLEYAQEKLDGQNLMVTFKDGVMRAARNKGQVKNYGENSLTIDQISKQFEGRGPIQTAFVETMRDLEIAINKLSPQEKADFFKNGERFISLEILFPETSNVIPYGAAQLRLHHFKQYDIQGNVQEEDVAGIYQLQKSLDTIKANQQKTFMIRTTDPAKLKADLDLPNQLKQFTADVDKVRSKYNLSDSQSVSEYVKRWWTDFIKSKAKDMQVKLPKRILELLVSRWAFTDKSVKIGEIKGGIADDKFRAWVDQFDKTEVEAAKKVALKPIELLFLKLGVRVLQNIENLTAVNPDEAKRKIKQDVSAAIRGIQKAADTESIEDSDAAIKFLKRELTRLKDIGGFNAIVPTEGLVFKYKGKLYKLTGAFAPINQILGYLRF